MKRLEVPSTKEFFNKDDFIGTTPEGRYVILCGSKGRLARIAEELKDVEVREHPRGYDLALGSYQAESSEEIPVAVVYTGIGASSFDCVFHFLLAANARTFLRVGTCGSLQPDLIKTGSVVIASAAVRDEGVSNNYIHPEYPAVGSTKWVYSAEQVALESDFGDSIYSGVVHTKDSLFAREFEMSLLKSNSAYMQELRNAGVLATDMETSLLYTLSQLANEKALKSVQAREQEVSALSILAVVGDVEPFSADLEAVHVAEERAVNLAFETISKVHQSNFRNQGEL